MTYKMIQYAYSALHWILSQEWEILGMESFRGHKKSKQK